MPIDRGDYLGVKGHLELYVLGALSVIDIIKVMH